LNGLRRTIRAFDSRKFRIFFTGQSVSLIGTWMQQVAVSWLAYRLTHSPMWLGIVAFAFQVPTLLFAPFGGAWADLWNRRRMLLVTQGLACSLALILALLTAMQIIKVGHLLAFGFLRQCRGYSNSPGLFGGSG
jgi:MFS family permease